MLSCVDDVEKGMNMSSLIEEYIEIDRDVLFERCISLDEWSLVYGGRLTNIIHK